MTQPAVLKHLDKDRLLSSQTARAVLLKGAEQRSVRHLPHQRVVVARFDLARVDHFSLERSETRAFGDAAFIRENPAVGRVSPRSLEDDQACVELKISPVIGLLLFKGLIYTFWEAKDLFVEMNVRL